MHAKDTFGNNCIKDGELRPGDAILIINGIDCQTVTHGSCVDILRNAGDEVKLLIGRKQKTEIQNGNLTSSNETINDSFDIINIRLAKNKSGLGFSIAGGIGNEHIEGELNITTLR